MLAVKRDGIKYGWLGFALVVGSSFAGSVMGQSGTQVTGNKPVPTQTSKTGSGQDSLRGWQRLDQEKDGAVFIRYDTPNPFSRVYTWRFRSTFDHPIHMDYQVLPNTLRGFPVRLERTAYIPANGKTDRFGVPSFVEPGISVEQVR